MSAEIMRMQAVASAGPHAKKDNKYPTKNGIFLMLSTSLALPDLPPQRSRLGEKHAMVYWHFFKPITIVLGGVDGATVPLKNSLGKELVWWNVYVQKLF